MNAKILLLQVIFCFIFLLSESDGSVPITEDKYKILMLLPFGSKSHRNVFIPIAEGLANKGHKVNSESELIVKIRCVFCLKKL